MKRQKFGILEYTTENIGDEIQSIAARRFLPNIDYYFDRDDINATKIKKEDKVKLIMNGWYTHKPENWPPVSKNIEPLFISMHIEQETMEGRVAKSFLSEKSLSFLRSFSPVGTRSYSTLELLQNNNIDSYFSGCLTLTLLPDKHVKKKDYILAVDVSDAVYNKIASNTNRPVIRLDTSHKTDISDKKGRVLVAQFWLYLYQSAHLVITTRLHTMLPCLALKTPVLTMIKKEPERFRGLIELTNTMSVTEFLSTPIDFENPAKNPRDYVSIKSALEKRCRDFTGFDSGSSYLNGKSIDEIVYDPSFLQLLTSSINETWLYEESLKKIKDFRDNLTAKESDIASLKKKIEELQSNVAELDSKLEIAKHPGVKGSLKLTYKAIARKIRKL